jgi:hypothetical protein
MRRWLAITAVCAAILVAPLWAQMHGGSSRGSTPSGHASFSSGASGHAAFGARSGPAFSSPGFSSRGFSGTAPRVGVRVGSGFHQSFGTRPTFGGGRGPFFGPRRFRGPVFFSSFSPFFFGYSGYPLYYSDYSYSMVDSYPAYDYYASASNQNSAYLVQQQQDIDRLEDEVARLREERESQETAPAQPPTESESQPSTPTLLVFRDKHTQEVQNYAVVGGTIWIFSEQRATKLPLSWLDIDATIKANDERGVNFRLPH